MKVPNEDLRELLDGFDPAEYEAEAAERWGETEAYRESARRTKKYGEEDWARYKAAETAANQAVVDLMKAGVAATDLRAMDAVEKHRLLIDEWFYPCSRAMHAELGRVYVADQRFSATYERIQPGMAEYMRDAIMANAARPE